MKVNDFAAVITALIVLSMQFASAWALYSDKLTFEGYASIWVPVLTAVMGYWFRGALTTTGNRPPTSVAGS